MAQEETNGGGRAPMSITATLILALLTLLFFAYVLPLLRPAPQPPGIELDVPVPPLQPPAPDTSEPVTPQPERL